MELIIASANQHKIEELRAILPNGVTLLSSAQVGITEDIEEGEDTLEGNALIKARYIYSNTGKACFADDTGLFVEALGGEPGVYSARYAAKAGRGEKFEDNIALLLEKLQGAENRSASFRTVIALIDQEGQQHLFEGEIKGRILEENCGEGGFGYDPIFVPEGYDKSFAQLPVELKNSISHRARAGQKLVDFLKNK